MTTSRIMILSAVLTLAFSSVSAMAQDGWGPSYSFGPSTSSLTYVSTTMVPGQFPQLASGVGPLFLWPGMSNSTGDLIQTTAEDWTSNAWCGASSGQWCVDASVFTSSGQINGPAVAIDPGDQVTIVYSLGADNETWTQTVTSKNLGGAVISTLQSASGPMPGTGFGFATEADANSYTIDNTYYINTEFRFSAPDTHWASTGVGGVGAQYGATGTASGIGTAENVRTTDGGTTWLVDLITLPAMWPQGTQTPPPSLTSTPTPTPTKTPTPTPTPTKTPTPTPTPTKTPTPTPAPGKCTIDYTISSQWTGGFGAAITIDNTSTTALTSWTLSWTFANGQTVSSLWNGVETQSGSTVTVTNESYNGSIAAGASYTGIGFNGTWNNVTNAIPTAISLNGVACTVN